MKTNKAPRKQNPKSVNLKSNPKFVANIGHLDVFENRIKGMMDAIDYGLKQNAPVVEATREFTEADRQLCEFGLNVAKFVLQRLDALGVIHKS